MTKPKNLSAASGISVYLEDVYLPPQNRRRQDIVDVVCSIMDDDGLKGVRPAQKKYGNAADQFASEHHGPYEARGRTNRDRIEEVHLHNSGYPKMHDELKRRRSTARVTAIAAQRNDAAQQRNYNICNTCMKNRKKEPKKRRLAPYRSHDTKHEVKRRNNGRRNSSRITKPKSRHPRKRSACKKCRSSKITIRSQCSSCSQVVEDTKRGIDKPRIVTDEKMVVEQRPSQCCDLNKKKTDAKQLHVNCDGTGSQCSKEGSSCPKGHETDASVSSYDSYASLENEPMDSK